MERITETHSELASQGGKHFFSGIKEGDELVFATDDENERHLWIQALCRATGQSYKPVPPKTSVATKTQGFQDKASKYGLEEIIQSDPIMSDHAHAFEDVQNQVLNFRMLETICSLVRLPSFLL